MAFFWIAVAVFLFFLFIFVILGGTIVFLGWKTPLQEKDKAKIKQASQKTSESEEGERTGNIKRLKDQLENFRELVSAVQNHPAAVPFYVPAAWFAFTGTFTLFGGAAVGDFFWSTNLKITLLTPLIALLFWFLTRAKSSIIKFFGWLVILVPVYFWGDAILTANPGKVFDWEETSIASASTSSETRAMKEPNIVPPFTLKTGEKRRIEIPPGWNFRIRVSGNVVVQTYYLGEKKKTLEVKEDDSPDYGIADAFEVEANDKEVRVFITRPR